jgi:VCBS repeat-containing protein
MANTTPTLSGLAASVSFNETGVNNGPRLIDSDVTFSDADNNFAGGSLVVSGLLAEDGVLIKNQGSGAGQISVSGSNVSHGGTVIGTFSGGIGTTLTVTFNANATSAAIDALIQDLTYANSSNTPTASRTLEILVTDAAGAKPVAPAAFTHKTGSDNPLDGIGISTRSKPAFGDLDGDGDLDMLLGVSGGTIGYFTNTGSATSPAFALQSGTANPLNGIDVDINATPALADIDGDGDLDVVVGDAAGTISYFKNTGSATAPVFAGQTGANNPFDAIDIPNSSAPSFADLDGDGDLDLTIGGYGGALTQMQNTGTATAPGFAAGANPFSGYNVGREATPSFGDLDGDGDLDIIVGERDGVINYLENTGSPSAPVFVARHGASNPLDGADIGSYSAPVLADLDGDGDLDAAVGTVNGNIAYFQNTAAGLKLVVNVTAENDAPVAFDTSGSILSDAVLNGAVAAASDVDGTVTGYVRDTDVAIGALTFNADGTYSYDPNGGFDGLHEGETGQDFFTYHAVDNDGGASRVAVVRIAVVGVNDAPIITSDGGGPSASVTVAENGTVVTTVKASDPDSKPSFAIAGGVDGGRFAIDASTGALSFKSAPDFESPADADGDNAYDVMVRASDGSAADVQTITVTVTDVSGQDIEGTKAADALTGSSEADSIAAGKGKDQLSGLGGDDRLDGGKGNDRLEGGEGGDSFLFGNKLKSNVDTILDFDAGVDTVVLASGIFEGLHAGALRSKAFVVGSAAGDGSDRVIYDDAKGRLLFDADGKGGKDALLFAKVGEGLDLGAGDFLVV